MSEKAKLTNPFWINSYVNPVGKIWPGIAVRSREESEAFALGHPWRLNCRIKLVSITPAGRTALEQSP